MILTGKIEAISISERKGIKKFNVPSAILKEEHGIIGDAHAGKWHRQISLLAKESIDKMRQSGLLELANGDFAENITTSNIELMTLPIGSKIKINETEMELTQIGKKCHNNCEIFKVVGDCVMPREGIFAKVLKGGEIYVNDEIIVEVKNDN
jgi:MOSC domain-containing protein YiiM